MSCHILCKIVIVTKLPLGCILLVANPSSVGSHSGILKDTDQPHAHRRMIKAKKSKSNAHTASKVVIHPLKMKGNVLSMASTSLLNRLRKRPVGVVSKNAMGKRSTLLMSAECSTDEACNVHKANMTEATITVVAVVDNTQKEKTNSRDRKPTTRDKTRLFTNDRLSLST